MKKILGILFILLTLVLITNQAEAQVDFGIRGGVNFATLNNVEEVDLGYATGFMAGVYANFPIRNSPVSIQPELLYTQKGYAGPEGIVEVSLNYISVPVLAKFDYVLDGPVTPHVYFGPYIAFNVSAEAEDEGAVISIEENVSPTDFGVVVGGGIDVNRFNLGVRYSVGLTPVFEDENTNAEAKNGVISIVAGFTF